MNSDGLGGLVQSNHIWDMRLLLDFRFGKGFFFDVLKNPAQYEGQCVEKYNHCGHGY